MNDLLTQLNGGNVPTLELLFMLTLAALLPSIVIMMTSFTRTIVILSFARNAMGVQQSPPNMVMVGIAMFLTLYIMSPVIERINQEAYQPYLREEISQQEAVERMVVPLKEFMLRNTRQDTLDNFIRIILIALSCSVKHLLLKCSADHLVAFIACGLDIYHVITDYV